MEKFLFALLGLAVGLAAGIIAGFFIRKKSAEQKISSAEKEADRIIDEGKKEAENLKKDALLEAKEKIIRDKNDCEREIKERRSEVSRLERRAIQREEVLEKKIENYEPKNKDILNSLVFLESYITGTTDPEHNYNV